MSFEAELANAAIARIVEIRPRRVAIVGYSSAALSVRSRLGELGFAERVIGVFDPFEPGGDELRAWPEFAASRPDLVIIASDGGKEALLAAVAGSLPTGCVPAVVLAGVGHLQFVDSIYAELDAPALVPSYATGYEFTRVHMFQCLQTAAANGLDGAVVEFGAFKGGTTAWLARTVRRLGLSSKVIAFDSWDGFPPRRSVLDLYEHPRCVFSDIASVRAYLEPFDVELVAGDITETASRLHGEPVLLAFVDTDNFSPALAALQVVLPNLVVGGSIVFDHYTTTSDYIYTVGERMAGITALKGAGLLHLHGTGVFVRIR